MLDGSELALTVVAAWALGLLGDPHAIPPLERALNSQYRSIRATLRVFWAPWAMSGSCLS